MHGPDAFFYESISAFLGTYYLFIAAMNGLVAYLDWMSGRSVTLFAIGPFKVTSSVIWLAFSLFVLILAPIAYSGDPFLMSWISIPMVVRHFINVLMNPTTYTLGAILILGVLYVTRRYWTPPLIAWLIFNAALLFMGFSMTDYNFAQIVTKADNVPIVGLIFLLGFFTWLATYKAVQNDERLKQGLEPLEKLDSEKILVWPDLVYTELICMVALTAFLVMWAVLLPAPLEEPASAVKTPNPSKAPWYFLGLQELLVYYDPWHAGVVLPLLVVNGLMAIPYLDFNKKGNGYYTIAERQFAYLTFQFGFFVLWILLIIMGTFLRGPNWNFFGPYETWDAHKVEVLNNVDLSQYFWYWVPAFGGGRPVPPEGTSDLGKFGYAMLREAPGFIFILSYLALLPPALVIMSSFFRDLFAKMGLIRYMTMVNLLLIMALVPLKMMLRWTINLKYFISLPEYMLNF
jgi:hypothetical protein